MLTTLFHAVPLSLISSVLVSYYSYAQLSGSSCLPSFRLYLKSRIKLWSASVVLELSELITIEDGTLEISVHVRTCLVSRILHTYLVVEIPS